MATRVKIGDARFDDSRLTQDADTQSADIDGGESLNLEG